MTSGFNNGHRKLLQPKQVKEFSPIKTALILDHYAVVGGKEGQLAQIKSEKKLIAKSIEKSYKLAQVPSAQQIPQLQDHRLPHAQNADLFNRFANSHMNQFFQIQGQQFHNENADHFKNQLLRPSKVVTRRNLIQEDRSKQLYFSQPRVVSKQNNLKMNRIEEQKYANAGSQIAQETPRYVSQEPPRRLEPMYREERVMAEDQELMSFQVEIERRYRNSQTKQYVFPRVAQTYETTPPQIELQDSLDEVYVHPSFISSLVNKYQGMQSTKYKERFVEKIKAKKPTALKESQSSSQLQVKSIQKIKSESNQMNINQTQMNQQQFFQNTHKRLNKNQSVKQLDNKVNQNNFAPNHQQSLIQSILNPYPVGPSTTKNSDKQGSYFISGKNELTRNIRSIIETADKQSIKQKQLGQLLKQMNGGNTGGITSSFVDANFNQANFKIKKQAIDGVGKSTNQQSDNNSNSQKSSVPQSPNHNKHKISSPNKHQQYQQQTPGSKPKAFQKLVNLQNQNFMQIVQSYKNFKHIDDLQSRTSRNSSQRSAQASSANRSKRGNSQEQQIIRSSIIGAGSMIQQNLIAVNRNIKTKKKPKQIASTLQITGSQALKKSYEFYNTAGIKSPQGNNQQSIPLSIKNKQTICSPHTGGSGFYDYQ